MSHSNVYDLQNELVNYLTIYFFLYDSKSEGKLIQTTITDV